MSPKTIIFWRNIVGIAIVLLAQHPRLYAGGEMFAGLWLGTFVIALGGAGVAAVLGYVFLTNTLRGKVWLVFVAFGWLLAVVQLFGEWALPEIMQRIAVTGKMNSSVSSAYLTPPATVDHSAQPAKKAIDGSDFETFVRSQRTGRDVPGGAAKNEPKGWVFDNDGNLISTPDAQRANR